MFRPLKFKRAGFVDDPRALVLLGLPDAERGALGIGEHRHPARLHDVEGLRHDAPAGIQHLRGGLVGALDPDVRVPGRRRWPALGLRADGGHVAAAKSSDEVAAGRARRHRVLELPSEQAAVEGDGGLRIGLAGVDPAWDAGHVSVSLEHWCSLLAWLTSRRTLRSI